MSEGIQPERAVAPGRKASLFLGGLLGIVLTVFIAGLAVWIYAGVGLISFFRSSLSPAGTTINVSQPTVVRQIQQLERLETVSYTLDKLVSGEHDSAYIPKFLIGDRLLLVVHGEVVAGVDLRKVSAADVVVHGRAISLRVPSAELFSTRIDNEKTRVYSRDTGLFTRPDPNLETEVRQEAERQLKEAALSDGILQTGGQNARATLQSLLKGFGFEQVDVR